MKVLKRAEQKNFVIDNLMYTTKELQDMLDNNEAVVFDMSKPYPECISGKQLQACGTSEDDVRIFATDVTDVKVICHEGHYVTVAIGTNGKRYFVNLNK